MCFSNGIHLLYVMDLLQNWMSHWRGKSVIPGIVQYILWMDKFWLYYIYVLFSVTFFLSFSYTVSHSHFFFTTVTNDITYYYPTYYSTRSIDDITLYWYDSNNEVIERRVPWFRRANSTLLDASISEFQEQQRMQRFLQMLKLGLNDTEGESTFQNFWGIMLEHDQH